jgi:predicted transcriptional regulator YdeE
MNTTKVSLDGFKLVGISLATKTTNKNGQSAIDCGNLWQQFENSDSMKKNHGRLSDEIVAVYYN